MKKHDGPQSAPTELFLIRVLTENTSFPKYALSFRIHQFEMNIFLFRPNGTKENDGKIRPS